MLRVSDKTFFLFLCEKGGCWCAVMSQHRGFSMYLSTKVCCNIDPVSQSSTITLWRCMLVLEWASMGDAQQVQGFGGFKRVAVTAMLK